MKKMIGLLMVVSLVISGIGVSGISEVQTMTVSAADTTASVDTLQSGFVHPGIMHTQESLDAVKANLVKQDPVTVNSYNSLLADGFSHADWNPRPLETVERGSGTLSNVAQMYIDIERAYQTALCWKLGAGEQYGEAAVRILNSWSHTMKTLGGNSDRFLASGIYGYQLANAAELVRDREDFDKEAMDTLLLNAFYPLTKDFLVNHNGTDNGKRITNYWANWDLANIAGMMAIGIFTDRRDIYEDAVSYYRNGEGNGMLYNAMPYVYPDDNLVQWQEAGRDQGHTTLGIGLCGAINEMAWSQGDDLYGLSDNRFLKATEYVAKYNNNEEVPFSTYSRFNSANGHEDTQTVVSGESRGMHRPVYTAIYNHYVNRMGLEMPELKKVLYPDDGDPYYELGQRNGDESGWQSLTFHNVGTRVSEERRTDGALADGVYRFINRSSNKALVDRDGEVHQAETGSTEEEWWQLTNTGDGEYIITNKKTGRVLQLDGDSYESNAAAYQQYNTRLTLAEKENSKINQRFAMFKNYMKNFYRIGISVSGFVAEVQNASADDNATIGQLRYEQNACQEWKIEKRRSETAYTGKTNENDAHKLVAEFNFDDETDGFLSGNAQAKRQGEVTLSTDSHQGKALKLSNGAYLEVKNKQDGALLAGCREFTISYWSKVDNSDTNWFVYLAANDNTQEFLQEKYIGVLESGGLVSAERYQNSGARPESAGGAVATGQWKQVTVVYGSKTTTVYVNGNQVGSIASYYDVADVLGKDGVFYIGKANWGEQGKFCDALIDQVRIYNYGLSEEEVSWDYEGHSVADLQPEVIEETPEVTPTPQPDKQEKTDTTVTENQSSENTTTSENSSIASSAVKVKSGFAPLKFNGTSKKKAIRLSWSKVKGADKYVIYGGRIGKKQRKIATVKGTKKSYTFTGCKKATMYQFRIEARNGSKKKAVSKTINVMAAGGKWKNPDRVTVKKKTVTIKAGAKYTLTPKVKSKGNVKYTGRKFYYECQNKKIVKINKKGKVTALKKGSTNIYIYTQNGKYQKVRFVVRRK